MADKPKCPVCGAVREDSTHCHWCGWEPEWADTARLFDDCAALESANQRLQAGIRNVRDYLRLWEPSAGVNSKAIDMLESLVK